MSDREQERPDSKETREQEAREEKVQAKPPTPKPGPQQPPDHGKQRRHG